MDDLRLAIHLTKRLADGLPNRLTDSGLTESLANGFPNNVTHRLRLGQPQRRRDQG
jgi:hypothetical protein